MPKSKGGRLLARRSAIAAVASGAGFVAARFVAAQAPLAINFVRQRGLLYLPADMMVTGGVLQQEATKPGLGKVEATARTLSGPAAVTDASPDDPGFEFTLQPHRITCLSAFLNRIGAMKSKVGDLERIVLGNRL